MIQSTTEIVIPVTDPQPMKIKLCTFFTAAYMILFECVHYIFTVASTIIRGRLLAPLHQVWDQYYRGVAFGEAGVFMPHSALSFVINALLAFAAIKSQGVPGFPFKTHPQSIMVSVTSLLIYGVASVAKLVVSPAGLDRTSVYVVTAHLRKVGSLCIFVVSLASLFYI
ncbi:hypothetical protein HanOQP8_Chr10g0359331 [Helianthus annuus]|nr:hypothetical protein HanOQP8_Chr10g0359331 [Helianthus annuus]KAJ0883113.1 hypothetical protein HanPSC8_Chr10g0417671 [Helianthus annuus]